MPEKTEKAQIIDQGLTRSVVDRIAPALKNHIAEQRRLGNKRYGANTFAHEVGLSDRKALANMFKRGSVSLPTLIKMCAISDQIRKEIVSFFLYCDEGVLKEIDRPPPQVELTGSGLKNKKQ